MAAQSLVPRVRLSPPRNESSLTPGRLRIPAAAESSVDVSPALSCRNLADRLAECCGRPRWQLPARAWLLAGRALRENQRRSAHRESISLPGRPGSAQADLPIESPRLALPRF